MKSKQIFWGCGITSLIVVLVVFLTLYFGAAAFFAFGIGTDLSDYRDAVQRMDIDPEIKNEIISDFEAVRLSLDEKNSFGFFQWLEIDDSIQGILADGKIDVGEYDSLWADISRMRKIQGIETVDGVEYL